MSNTPTKRHTYAVETIVMRPDGNTHVKTANGWVAEHRLAIQMQIGRELEPNEKVFHLDNTLRGEKGFNHPRNLTVIRCRTTKWVKISHSRVVYEPKVKKYREYVGR